jgi:hypothetical protein
MLSMNWQGNEREARGVNFLRFQLANSIANGHVAMRVERDERAWLDRAIEKGRREIWRELWKAYAEFIRERRAA